MATRKKLNQPGYKVTLQDGVENSDAMGRPAPDTYLVVREVDDRVLGAYYTMDDVDAVIAADKERERLEKAAARAAKTEAAKTK